MFRFRAEMILWLSLMATAGCLSSPAEEMEHHTAAHMPADFLTAVKRLTELHESLMSDTPAEAPTSTSEDSELGNSSDEEIGVEPLTEMSDIARWMPELAADSDLPEQPWLLVNESAQNLESILTPIVKVKSKEKMAIYRENAAQIEECLREINAAAEEYPVVKQHQGL